MNDSEYLLSVTKLEMIGMNVIKHVTVELSEEDVRKIIANYIQHANIQMDINTDVKPEDVTIKIEKVRYGYYHDECYKYMCTGA